MNQTELRLRAIELGRQSDDPWTKVFARWLAQARPDQLAPAGDWLVWLIQAGRGAGKTRAGAEHVNQALTRRGHRRAHLVGATAADVRDVMVEGPSGILACAPPDKGRPRYEPSKRRITYYNGAVAHTFSAEEPDRLRGPQCDVWWGDEPAAWQDAARGDALDTTFNNAMLGLRLGTRPHVVLTTTPRRVRLIRELVARPSTVVTRASTYANLPNLAATFRQSVLAAYEGTRLGRQELHGELLEDVEGALWKEADILHGVFPDQFSRVVVAVDPSGSKAGDEVGIVAAGKAGDRGYVLADASGQFTPEGWARAAVSTYHDLHADRIVAEVNFGGDMVSSTLRQVDPNIPVKVLHASRGKLARAEPISAMYEQHRWTHCGTFPLLEEEMLTWTPNDPQSPNRLDALVWCGHELFPDRAPARLRYIA